MEAVAKLSPTEVREKLVAHGVQPSAPRLAIAHYVWNTRSHPTAEDVKREVEKNFPMVSLATVYNTLNLLVEKGLVREVPDPSLKKSGREKSMRYDCNVEPHFHFIDEETGEMFDLHPGALKISPNSDVLGREFKVNHVEVTLRGRRITQPQKRRS